MPENGTVFAQKVFNTTEYPGAPGNNFLRDKGYAIFMQPLVFDQSVYGQLGYGPGQSKLYGDSAEQSIIKWVYTSSITQSFYDANPQISRDEILLVVNQNYIPTGSAIANTVGYNFYIPITRVNTNIGWTTRPTAVYEPISGSLQTISFEYYWLAPAGGSHELEVKNFTGSLEANGFIHTTLNLNTFPSGTITFTTQSDATAPWYTRLRVNERATITGDIMVLRNLSISYSINSLDIEPFAQTQDLHLQTSTGMTNARYNGSKMTSPDFNIDSPDTVDGGPVVTVTPVNPNSPTIGTTARRERLRRADIDGAGFVSGKGNFKIQ